MGIPKKSIKRPNSRPQKLVDWDLVDELLVAGCSGPEIAPYFDMHSDTLYRKTEEQYGVTFTAYSQQKRSKGDSCLRKAQYDKALTGDNTMLIWLGKQRLLQKENVTELKDVVVHELRAGLKQISEESRSQTTEQSEVET